MRGDPEFMLTKSEQEYMQKRNLLFHEWLDQFRHVDDVVLTSLQIPEHKTLSSKDLATGTRKKKSVLK